MALLFMVIPLILVLFLNGSSNTNTFDSVKNIQVRMKSINEAKDVNKSIKYVEGVKAGNKYWNIRAFKALLFFY